MTYYRDLQREILSNIDCAPYINDGTDPYRKASYRDDDAKVAEIISKGRKRIASNFVSERGVRQALSVVDAAKMIKLFRDIESATSLPAEISSTLLSIGIGVADHWAYLDTLQCAYGWLKDGGIDVGASKTIDLLDIIALAYPDLRQACKSIRALGEQDDPVSPADVSRALRGPWEDN